MRRRTRWTERAAALVLVAALLMPAQALGDPPDDADAPAAPGPNLAEKVVDAVVMRPLGFCAAIAGAALFPFVALATAPEGRSGIEEAWELLVLVPGKSVFQRPLGDF